jgi:hypothetical protein
MKISLDIMRKMSNQQLAHSLRTRGHEVDNFHALLFEALARLLEAMPAPRPLIPVPPEPAPPVRRH